MALLRISAKLPMQMSRRLLTLSVLKPVKKMAQVDVESDTAQKKLGTIQMSFVRKVEKENADRAKRHVIHRKKDIRIGVACAVIIFSIYTYTIYAIKQEKFLDDFEMPDPMAEKK